MCSINQLRIPLSSHWWFIYILIWSLLLGFIINFFFIQLLLYFYFFYPNIFTIHLNNKSSTGIELQKVIDGEQRNYSYLLHSILSFQLLFVLHYCFMWLQSLNLAYLLILVSIYLSIIYISIHNVNNQLSVASNTS